MPIKVHTEPRVVINCEDSQAAIMAVGSPKDMSGQHIVRRVVQAIYRLRQTGYPPILVFGATRQQTSRQKKQQAGG